MDQVLKQRFCNTYRIVFDENGNTKACGREATVNLIGLADSLEPDIKHGNIVNGMMNINLMRSLYQKVV